MSQQRVFLLGRPGLFAEGVRDILERQSDMEIFGPYVMTVDAIAPIEAFGPNVVVIADEGAADAALVGDILRTYPDLPVVRVGLEESMVHVYRSERVAATSTSFLDAIRGLLDDSLP